MKRFHASVQINVAPHESVVAIAAWVEQEWKFFHPAVAPAIVSEDDGMALLERPQYVRRSKLGVDVNLDEDREKHFHGSVKESIQKHFDYMHPQLEAVVVVDSSFTDGFALLGETDEPASNGWDLLGETPPDIPPDLLALLDTGEPPGADLLS